MISVIWHVIASFPQKTKVTNSLRKLQIACDWHAGVVSGTYPPDYKKKKKQPGHEKAT